MQGFKTQLLTKTVQFNSEVMPGASKWVGDIGLRQHNCSQ